MIKDDNKHMDLTHKIIGAAMEVHTKLGNGFAEIIYHRAMMIELELRDIPFVNEQEFNIYYKGQHVGKRITDLFAYNLIPVELKAVKELDNADICQAKNQLEAAELEVGLLINFGAPSLLWNRITNNKLKFKEQ